MPVDVKFMVDMSNEDVSSNGVHIAGDFQGWDPSSSQMTDEDGDGIYETSFELNIGTYQYKFVNGDDWSGTNNDNESVLLIVIFKETGRLFSSDSTIQFCYNQCVETCLDYPSAAKLLLQLT